MRVTLLLAAMALLLGLSAPAFAQAGGPETPAPPDSGPATGRSSAAGAQVMIGMALITAGAAQATSPSSSTGRQPSDAPDSAAPQPNLSATGTAR